jgi:diguanylate cyclase (GGDEF)-like protein
VKQLSLNAKAYIGASIAIATVAAIAHLPALLAMLSEPVAALQLVLITAIATTLSVFRVFSAGDHDNYDLAWALFGLALIFLGPAAAIVVICASNIATMLSKRYKWPWYVHVFNIASFILAASLAGVTRAALAQLPGYPALVAFSAIAAAIVVFTLFNHLHVAGVLWLTAGITPAKSGLFSVTSLLADASLLSNGAVCAQLAPINPYAILLGAAPLLLIHSALRMPRIERFAKIDGKTGLLHAKDFQAQAEREFERARRLNRPLTMAMVDLDMLRDINNTHGHLAGDDAIRAVADAMRKCAQPDDVVARFGGEEFALLMVEHDLGSAQARAERVREEIAATMPALRDGKRFNVTASIGLAERGVADVSLSALIERADKALYDAKQNGRNRVCARA